MTEIFTAKTVEEAKAMAVKKFGKNASIKFEILEEPSKGFLGFGAKDAKVKATVNDASAAPKKAETAAAAPAETKTDQPEAKEVITPEPVKTETPAPAVKKEEAPAPAKTEIKPETKTETTPAAKAEENAPADDDESYSIDNFTLIEDEALINPKVKLARDYITSILTAIGVDAKYTVYQNETGAVLNIDSDNNGTIIGRRGETLDALQYLCSIIANKGDKDYFRITIDCLGYRNKRKDTLEQLAAKVARSVLKTGRSQPLEPMNPYERRVIHSAISKIEGVSSRSTGEEPYRKIIISSNNPRRNDRRRDDRRAGRRNDNNNRRGGERRNRNDRSVNMERRSVDLSTSFEKDYKRPKPEDSIEGGLYGKIEF